MRRSMLLPVLIGLILCPLAQAGPNLPFKASAVQAPGNYDLSGALVGFLQGPALAGAAMPSTDFSLSAPLMRVEVDSADTSLRTGVVDVPFLGKTTPHNFTTATLAGESARENLRWTVVAQPGAPALSATLAGACGTGQPSDGKERHTFPRVQPRATVAIPTEGAMVWSTCSNSATLIVRGDLLLVLWETDVSVASAQDSTPFWSGSRPVTAAPTPSQDHELWVYALNATLTIPISQGTDFTAILAPGARAHAEHGFRLEGADLPSLAEQGESIQMEGNLTVTMSNEGGRIGGALAGDLTRIVADGKVLDVGAQTAAVAVGPTTWTPWLLYSMIALGLVVLVAPIAADRVLPLRWFRLARRHADLPPNYTVSTMRHRRAGGYWAKGQEWLERGWNRRASWVSRRALSLRPDNAAHGLLRVTILDELGRDKAALKVLQRLYAQVSAGKERALVALDVAATLVKLERAHEAKEWIARAERDDATAVAAAAENPYFQHLHGVRPPVRARVPDADPSFA